jgi:hypothetical protein
MIGFFNLIPQLLMRCFFFAILAAFITSFSYGQDCGSMTIMQPGLEFEYRSFTKQIYNTSTKSTNDEFVETPGLIMVKEKPPIS